jgi:hypothetical protein
VSTAINEAVDTFADVPVLSSVVAVEDFVVDELELHPVSITAVININDMI